MGRHFVIGHAPHLAERPRSRVDERVRHTGWHDHNLAADGLDHVFSRGERSVALMYAP